MRSVVCCDGLLSVRETPEPTPDRGQLLLRVLACGICGSDLHHRRHADAMADSVSRAGYPRYARSSDPVILGHEICGEVLARGPGTRGRHRVGDRVVALPLVRRGRQVDAVGLSAAAPGGYAERVVVQDALSLRVPENLTDAEAALTEPLAVAWHAVARGEPTRDDVAVVLGCGPVGLAVITLLKARGVRSVVASDPNSERRRLARQCGADVVVDPEERSPYDAAPQKGYDTITRAYNTAIDVVEKLSLLPIGWWHAWRALSHLRLTTPKRPIVFECVGAPGMLDGLLAAAPLYCRVVVVGVCMGADTWHPALATNKEVDLRFVVGYTPLEFHDTLQALSRRRIDVGPLLTGAVGLEGVTRAFEVLAGGGPHAKILIDPTLTGDAIRTASPGPIS